MSDVPKAIESTVLQRRELLLLVLPMVAWMGVWSCATAAQANSASNTGEQSKLFQVIDEVPRPDRGGGEKPYDPRLLIRAVNALQPLGKDGAIAEIADYLRIKQPNRRDRGNGALLLLRTLFDPPPEQNLPSIGLGGTTPREPSNPKDFPKFPLMVVDDVPFLMARVTRLGGNEGSPEGKLAYYRRFGVLRPRPLKPPSDVVALFDHAWKEAAKLDGERSQQLVVEQILLLLEDAYKPPSNLTEGRIVFSDFSTFNWPRIREEIGKLAIHWDEKASTYKLNDK